MKARRHQRRPVEAGGRGSLWITAAIVLALLFMTSGCEPDLLATLTLDGGELVDASQPLLIEDAGDDAGATRDAGVVDVDDAGPPFVQEFPDAGPCPPQSDTMTSHVCEGDEDLCEPVPDIGLPDFDILGVWSRVEGDEFVIDALFLRRPFTFPGHIDLAFVIDSDTENDDCRQVDNDPAAEASADLLVFVTNQEDPNGVTYYPPIQFYVLESCDGFTSLQYLDASTHLRLSVDGHVAQIRLPIALVQRTDGAAPMYAININHAGDVSCGDEFPLVSVDSFVNSRNGAPDVDYPFPVQTEACILGEPLGAPCLGD